MAGPCANQVFVAIISDLLKVHKIISTASSKLKYIGDVIVILLPRIAPIPIETGPYSGSQKLWAALKIALINWEIKIMKWNLDML